MNQKENAEGRVGSETLSGVAPIHADSAPEDPATDVPNDGVQLRQVEISSDVLKLLPAEFVKEHGVLPIVVESGLVRIATARTGNDRVRRQPRSSRRFKK